MKPALIVGGMHADARGNLRFCNDFDMSEVKRFYTVSNSKEQPKRGWIGHKCETKWFFPLIGRTTLVVEPMGRDPSAVVPEYEFLLDAKEPKILRIPGGNWFCIQQDDGEAEVLVFSNCKVGEFQNDNFRKDYDEEA